MECGGGGVVRVCLFGGLEAVEFEDFVYDCLLLGCCGARGKGAFGCGGGGGL